MIDGLNYVRAILEQYPAPNRRKFATFTITLPVAFAVALALLLAIPVHAIAQGLGGLIDPSEITTVQAQIGTWTSLAQGYAFKLYTALFVFELIVVAITTLLFRENIGEFFSSLTLKILMGGVVMYLIYNAGTFFPSIIASFTQAGQSMGGVSSPWAMIGLGLATGVGFYLAAAAGHTNDVGTAFGAGTFVVGTGDAGAAYTAATGHFIYAAMCQFLGFIVLLAFAGIALQFILTTIESYIVMSAGIIFIGFTGSRFTMPFAQGYFSYVISAGTKLFTMYLILGVEQSMLPGIIAKGGAAVLAADAIPFGIGNEVAIGIAAWATIQVVVATAILWAVPNFAASFLSGSSSISAGATMATLAQQSSGLQSAIGAAFGGAGGGRGGHGLHGGHANGAPGGMGAAGPAGGMPFAGAANGAQYAASVGDTPGTSSFVNAAAGNAQVAQPGGVFALNGSGSSPGSGTGNADAGSEARSVPPGSSFVNAASGNAQVVNVSGPSPQQQPSIENASALPLQMASATPSPSSAPGAPESASTGAPPISSTATATSRQAASFASSSAANGAPGTSAKPLEASRASSTAPITANLDNMSVSQMKSLSDSDFVGRFHNTSSSELTTQQREAIANDPRLSGLVGSVREVSQRQSKEPSAQKPRGVNSFDIPRDSATVSAAQIRMGSPDKL